MQDNESMLDFLDTFGLKKAHLAFGAAYSDLTMDEEYFMILDSPEKWESDDKYKTLWILNSFFFKYRSEVMPHLQEKIYSEAIIQAGRTKDEYAGDIVYPIIAESFHEYVLEWEVEIACEVERAKSLAYG